MLDAILVAYVAGGIALGFIGKRLYREYQKSRQQTDCKPSTTGDNNLNVVDS